MLAELQMKIPCRRSGRYLGRDSGGIDILYILAGVPVGGKSSVCLICMKYMIIILIKVSITVRIGGASDSRLCRK